MSAAAHSRGRRRKTGRYAQLWLALAMLVWSAGCFSLGDEGGGCSGTGDLGNVDFAFDSLSYGTYGRRAGVTLAVGSFELLELHEGLLHAPIRPNDVELRSSAPEVARFEFLNDGTDKASVVVVGPGRAKLELYRKAELLDSLEIQAESPSAVLVRVAPAALPTAFGQFEDGLSEPGVVLTLGSQVELAVTLLGPDFSRLSGGVELTARSGDDAALSVEDTGQAYQSTAFYSTFRLTASAETQSSIEFWQNGRLVGVFPVRVEQQPQVSELRGALYQADGSALLLDERSIFSFDTNYLLGLAFNAQGWRVMGLPFAFESLDQAFELSPTEDGSAVRLVPGRKGASTLLISVASQSRKFDVRVE